MVEPIRPSEVSQVIPEWVIKGTNECIKEHYLELKQEAYFSQDTLMEYVLKYAPEGVTRKTVFNNHWLDVEPTFRKAGWDVKYYKPPYYETKASATFTFKPSKQQ